MLNIRLLLISRADILSVMNADTEERAIRLLTSLTRQGFHFLATAPQPEQWAGEHGSPDDALLGPNSIRKRLSDAGGILDGVYYDRRSLLTQKRNREDALQEILHRYDAKPRQCVLLSSKRNFVKAARKMGLKATLLDADHELVQELSNLNDMGVNED